MINLSKFQLAILAIFSISIVGGLVSFSVSKGSSSSIDSANLLVWGTISQNAFDALYNNSTIRNSKKIEIKYVKKDLADFQKDFVESLSDGTGPDVVILREDYMYQNRNKIFTIPYKSYPARTFKDRFIEEAEMFFVKDGVIALPLVVDPMVMYWNRDIFSNNQISLPPKYWDEFTVSDNNQSLVSKITKRDNNANILLSTVALGEWRNIVNAKEILSMFLLQAGTPITTRENDDKVSSVLNSNFNYQVAPSFSAVTFYTQFSNPTSATYTWNRSLPNSINMFLAGNLATYIGFASEIYGIQQKNSNLNFDVTYVPQIRSSNKKSVFAHMYGASIVKQSKQIPAAFNFIVSLTEPGAIKAMEAVTNLPPVRRDLLAYKPTEDYMTIFYDSALISHSWIDPNPTQSSNSLMDMIESITSGKSGVNEAINRAESEISQQLN